MATIVEDPSFFENLVVLSQCVCESLADAGFPKREWCFCGVVGGSAVEFDLGPNGEGKAWVRLVEVYPSTTFPNLTQATNTSCAAPLVAQVEVGAIICRPNSPVAGGAPNESQWLESVRKETAIMSALRKAIQCCLPHEDKILGTWTPFGPEGGVIGGRWSMYLSEKEQV